MHGWFAHWARRHPARIIIYTTLLVAGATGLVLIAAALAGRADGLLTRLARAAIVRHQVERQFGIRYDLERLRLGACDCGIGVELEHVSVALLEPDALALRLGDVRACSSLATSVQHVRIGPSTTPDSLELEAVSFSPADGIRGAGLVWRDSALQLVALGSFAASLETQSGELRQLRIPIPGPPEGGHYASGGPPEGGHYDRGDEAGDSLLVVRSITVGPATLRDSQISVQQVAVRDGSVMLERRDGPVPSGENPAGPPGTDAGEWNFTTLQAGFTAAAEALQRSGEASDRALVRARRAAGRLLLGFTLVSAALLVLVKVLVTRVPARRLRRVVVLLVPFLVCAALLIVLPRLASVIGAAFVTLAAGAIVVLLLHRFAYRHAPEWHQRWEPAGVDAIVFAAALVPIVACTVARAVPRLPPVDSVHVAGGLLENFTTRIRMADCGREDAVLTHVSQARLTNLLAVIAQEATGPPAALSVEHVTAAGQTENHLLPDLARLSYLPPAFGRLPPVAFCVDATVRARPRDPVRSGHEPDGGPAAPLSGGCRFAADAFPRVLVRTSIDPAALTAQFAAEVRDRSLSMSVEGHAGAEGATLERIQSLDGSALRIADGRGSIAWSDTLRAELRLDELELSAGDGQGRVRSLLLDAEAGGVCRAAPLSLALQLGRATYGPAQGYRLASGDVSVNVARPERSRATLEVGASELRVEGRRPNGGSDWLSADVPRVTFRADLETSAQQIPQVLAGRASFSVGEDASHALLSLQTPIHFRADTWTGEWQLDRQRIVLRQALSTRLEDSIALDVSTRGRLESLATPLQANVAGTVAIARLVPAVDPLRLELNGLQIDGGWSSASGPHANFSTDWNRATLPALPDNFALREISHLRVKTEGTANPEATAGPWLPDWRSLSQQLERTLSARPEHVDFRLEGSAASAGLDVNVIGRNGQRLVLSDLETRLIGLSVRNGRLASAEWETDVRGVRASEDAAGLDVSLRTRLADDAVDVAVLAPAGTHVQLRPGRVRFALAEPLDLEHLMPALQPFLRLAGLDLRGIDLRTRIVELNADAAFSGHSLSGFSAEAVLGSGSIVDLDLAQLSGSASAFSRLSVSQQAPATLRLSAPDLSQLVADVRLGGLTIDADDGSLHASVSADASLRGSLVAEPATPLSSRMAEACAGLGRHAERALAVFGSEPGDRPVHWNVDLRGRESPVLVITPDQVRADLEADLTNVSNGTAMASGIVGVTAVARLHRGDLVIDADIPADLSIGSDGEPLPSWTFRLPVLAVLKPGLTPATTNSGELWDPGFYDHFWSSYWPGPSATVTPLLGRHEIAWNGFSARGLFEPAGPLQVAIGYGDALGLHAPLDGTLLHGTATGLLQARVAWDAGGAEVSSYGAVALRNIQAGDLGTDGGSGHVSWVEDTLDGDIQFSTRGMRIDAVSAGRWVENVAEATELDTVDLRAVVRTARTDPPLPGWLQLRTGLALRPADESLQRVVHQLRLLLPPQGLTYQGLTLDLHVREGRLQADRPWLDLERVVVPGEWPLRTEGRIRVFWGRPESGEPPIRFRHFLGLLQTMLGGGS